jgi:hypothetical protein
MRNSHTHTNIGDEQFDAMGRTTAAHPLPVTPQPPSRSTFTSHLHFGARAAVLAGVVATACAAAVPAAGPATVAAPATHLTATVTLNGPSGGFITPADSSCCM